MKKLKFKPWHLSEHTDENGVVWREIPDTDGAYFVSHTGLVKSVTSILQTKEQHAVPYYRGGIIVNGYVRGSYIRKQYGRILKQSVLIDNRNHTTIKVDVNRIARRVPVLVAEAFVDGYSSGLYVRHRDNDITNNNYDNLYMNTSPQIHVDQATAKKIIYEYACGDTTHGRLGIKYGLSQGNISNIINRRYKYTQNL